MILEKKNQNDFSKIKNLSLKSQKRDHSSCQAVNNNVIFLDFVMFVALSAF